MDQAMLLPPPLQTSISDAMEAVRDHPQHQLAGSRRRDIYTAMGPFSQPMSIRARRWLAILSAWRVAPLFRAALPDETIFQRCINLAMQVALGTLRVTSPDVYVADDEAYLWWCSWSIPHIPWQAEMAQYAARNALLEVEGYRPEQFLVEEWLPDRDLEQEDAAGAAAMTTACISFAEPPKPVCLRMFWEWWLKDAIPEAWRAAGQGTLPETLMGWENMV